MPKKFLFYLILSSLFTFCLLIFDHNLSCSWLPTSMCLVDSEMSFISIIFSISLITISIQILFFSDIYMGLAPNFSQFANLLLLFIFSMLILIFHNSPLQLFLGWDGLGITSFLLVAFYSNWYSTNGALSTIMTNRLGDCLMLLFLVLFLPGGVFSPLNWVGSGLLMVACFTKSSQIPFNSWLPQAMSAPTPVSSLVHSSTLVTAGIYTLFKYSIFLGSLELFSLFVVGLGSMTLGNLFALGSSDMKKVVAFSTLSQLGFIIMILGLGLPFFAFFHLIIHSFCKSCLFIQVGLRILFLFLNQDLRSSYLTHSPHFSLLFLFCCILGMSGMLFMGLGVSKDIILLKTNTTNPLLLFTFLFNMSMCMTISYSMKLMSGVLHVTFKVLTFGFSSKQTLLSGLLSGVISTSLPWVLVNNLSVPLSISSSSKFQIFGMIFYAMIILIIISPSLLNYMNSKILLMGVKHIKTMFFLEGSGAIMKYLWAKVNLTTFNFFWHSLVSSSLALLLMSFLYIMI